jgi:hypothetical protein
MELYSKIHGNEHEFFQGYNERVEFLQQMTAKVKSEFSDTETEPEQQRTHSPHTEFEDSTT